MMRFLFLSLLAFYSINNHAQNLRDILVSPADNGKIFLSFLHEIETSRGVDFICDENKMQALTVYGIKEKQRFTDFLDLYAKNFRVIRITDKVYFVVETGMAEKYGLNKENYIVLKTPESRTATIGGTVLDGTTNESLIGAKVFFPGSKTGMLTDTEGKFSIQNLPIGILHLNVQYVGYEVNDYIVGFSKYATATRIDAVLFPESKVLQSVTVTADRVDENVTSQLTGIEKLSIETIKSLPTFLGEVDPIRSLTTLPGVSTTGELASGFNVRGGEAGQNLVLQDGATIYNPSHLFGFFSAFNPDMVSNVTLYKGGGPANFGTRVSSVLDISLRNGDATKHTVNGGIGLISSRLSLEGPILRNRSSYLIGGRISYCNWLVKATDNISLRNSAARFRDITAKIFHTFNDNNYLSISAYNSYDDFKLATDTVFSWGTLNASIKWDHTFSETLNSALSFTYSDYSSEVNSIDEIEAFTYINEITNANARYDFNYHPSAKSKFSFGLEAIRSIIEPGRRIPGNGINNVPPLDMNDQHMIEGALYTQADIDLTAKFSVSAGLRYSYFARLGPDSIRTYDYSVMESRYPSVSALTYYDVNEVISTYSGLEPRISLRFLINPASSLKASYYRGYQYMHLISNTTSTTPQDYWIGSGPQLKPQRGDQFSLGYFRNLQNDRFEISAEGFYKNIQDAVDYIEGADITLNPKLEAGLSQGKGLAYGIEWLFKKKSGKLNGWVAYTYARSLRKFEQSENKLAINGGKYYPATFDQPHIVSVVANLQVGGRGMLSANFNYSTGRPITIPVQKFSYDVYLSVLNYSQRNEYRIPDYHRLDLSFTLKDRPKKNREFRSEWIFSIFNLYGRKNTYSITFDRYGNASKLSVLGSVFPSLTYTFRF